MEGFVDMKIKYLIVSLLVTASMYLSGLVPAFYTNKADAALLIKATGIVSATITGDRVNVRQGPSTSSKVVCMLYKGDSVKVLSKLDSWYAIYHAKTGCVGAVYGKYLNIYWPKTNTPVVTARPSPRPSPVATQPGMGNPSSTMAPPSGTVPGVSTDEQKVLQLVNKARSDSGAGPLSIDPELQKVARLKAKDLVDNNYFSHQSPTYGSPFDMMRQFGITFRTAGENLAGNSTVEGAFNAWMNSPGHKQNILNGSFNLTGIGVVSSPTYGKMFVQQFIGR